MDVLGLGSSHRLSLVVASGRYSLVVEHGLLIVVTPLVAEHRPESAQASVVVAHDLSRGMWNLPRDWTRVPCISRRTLNHWTIGFRKIDL